MTSTDADLTEMPFRCGHEKTPENSIVRAGYKRCRTCSNAYQRAYQRKRYAERNPGVVPTPPVDPLAFRCGHPKNAENSALGPALSIRCRTCAKDRLARTNAAKQEIATELRNIAA